MPGDFVSVTRSARTFGLFFRFVLPEGGVESGRACSLTLSAVVCHRFEGVHDNTAILCGEQF